MGNKLKHLDFIQDAIKRMANNSFLLKGWAVTLVLALFALLRGDEVEPNDFLIGLLPVAVFWLLDGYFLYQEKLFIRLYNKIRVSDEKDVDFSMDTRPFRVNEDSIRNSVCSDTLILFYGVLFLTVIIINKSL